MLCTAAGLLVQRKLLMHLSAGAQFVPSGPEGYRSYCRERWEQLGKLKRLFDQSTDDVLVGKVSLVVPGGQQQAALEFHASPSGQIYRTGSAGAAAAALADVAAAVVPQPQLLLQPQPPARSSSHERSSAPPPAQKPLRRSSRRGMGGTPPQRRRRSGGRGSPSRSPSRR
jgi:hypothetical protein